MRIVFWILCSILASVSRVSAHEEMIGPLQVVEKVYGAPAPIGRIVIRYDGTVSAKPKLQLRSNLFKTELSGKAISNLPRPDWDGVSVPYSLTSVDVKTRKFVKRPYLYISVPLHGPIGKSWENASVLYLFNENGRLRERRLKQFIPVKDRRHRTDLPRSEADYIDTLYVNWPLASNKTAEQALAQELAKAAAELKQ